MIETCQKYQVPYENTKADLMEQYGLQEEKADEYMQKYFCKNIQRKWVGSYRILKLIIQNSIVERGQA